MVDIPLFNEIDLTNYFSTTLSTICVIDMNIGITKSIEKFANHILNQKEFHNEIFFVCTSNILKDKKKQEEEYKDTISKLGTMIPKFKEDTMFGLLNIELALLGKNNYLIFIKNLFQF